MKKNILIIGLTGILGTFVALSSCGPDYETEFNVLTLTIPSESQAAVVFPLSGGEHEIEVETNVALDNWTVSSNAEYSGHKQNGQNKQNKCFDTLHQYGSLNFCSSIICIGYYTLIPANSNIQHASYATPLRPSRQCPGGHPRKISPQIFAVSVLPSDGNSLSNWKCQEMCSRETPKI